MNWFEPTEEQEEQWAEFELHFGFMIWLLVMK